MYVLSEGYFPKSMITGKLIIQQITVSGNCVCVCVCDMVVGELINELIKFMLGCFGLSVCCEWTMFSSSNIHRECCWLCSYGYDFCSYRSPEYIKSI